jgi:hypothetical protein
MEKKNPTQNTQKSTKMDVVDVIDGFKGIKTLGHPQCVVSMDQFHYSNNAFLKLIRF